MTVVKISGYETDLAAVTPIAYVVKCAGKRLRDGVAHKRAVKPLQLEIVLSLFREAVVGKGLDGLGIERARSLRRRQSLNPCCIGRGTLAISD